MDRNRPMPIVAFAGVLGGLAIVRWAYKTAMRVNQELEEARRQVAEQAKKELDEARHQAELAQQQAEAARQQVEEAKRQAIADARSSRRSRVALCAEAPPLRRH